MEVRDCIILILFLYLFSGTSAAQQQRTNLELIESVKDISLSSDIYSDTANIKNLAVLFLSSVEGNTRDSDYNKFADSIKKFLEEFNTLFFKSRDGQPADHKNGVKKAINLRDETVYLESLYRSSKKLEGPVVADIVNKEKKSIDRFLEGQAKYFEELTEKEVAVPLKIEYMEYATMAYREAGNARYESAEKELTEIESNFKRDIGLASNYSEKADGMINNLKKNGKGLFALFSGYIESKNAVKSYTNAVELYHDNGISEKTLPRLPESYVETYNELIIKKRDSEIISSSIFYNLITSLLKIITPLLLMLIIFMYGFREWKKDFADTNLNRIVTGD